jgi:hypothetical protein
MGNKIKNAFMNFGNRFMRDNSGQAASVFTGILGAAITFTVLILATSLVSGVVADVRDGQTLNEADYNVSSRGLTGMLNLSGQYGNMGTVLAVVGIISLLLGAFAVFQTRR